MAKGKIVQVMGPVVDVVFEDGNYTEEEKKTFLEIVKNGSSFFFKYARLGGLEIA